MNVVYSGIGGGVNYCDRRLQLALGLFGPVQNSYTSFSFPYSGHDPKCVSGRPLKVIDKQRNRRAHGFVNPQRTARVWTHREGDVRQGD